LIIVWLLPGSPAGRFLGVWLFNFFLSTCYSLLATYGIDMKSIAFMTLGCKVNQYETALLKDNLKKDYHILYCEEKADIYIINTCTVTKRSDQKSRQYIRRVLLRNLDAEVIVTGCYAHRFPEEIKSISNRCIVFNNDDKQNILNYLGIRAERQNSILSSFDGHARAFVKVQDGCDSFCAYCAVPYARTRIYSKPLVEVIREIKELLKNGYKEIVLCGINLGIYQSDSMNLSDLLIEISNIKGLRRLRLSSLEPDTITDRLIETLSNLPNFCRFLHIPLQSGDDNILGLMKRRYNIKTYRYFIERLKVLMPDIAISSDIIVGFPGEDDISFEKTCNMIKSIGFARLHIFRFSPRPGTSAFNITGRLPYEVVKERADRLAVLEKGLRKKFYSKYLDKEVEVLFEKRESRGLLGNAIRFKRGQFISGLTRNYIKIIAEGYREYINRFAAVKIVSVLDKFCLGKII